jgi:hypothetical protein
MASITGFGGIFLRADDPKALYQWYEQHLGLVKSDGAFAYPAPTQHPQVVFALFKQDNAYFLRAQKAMINLQLDDLDGVVDRLIDEGVTVDPKRESYDFGKSAGSPTQKETVSSFGSLSQRNDAEAAPDWSPEVGPRVPIYLRMILV